MHLKQQPWLKSALHALWLQTVALRASGALALLEPRVSLDGPSIRTDGHTLWVDAHTLEGWLEAPPTEPDKSPAVESLAATGLAVLYAWRGEPGPWVKPFMAVDPVMQVDANHPKGDWLRAQLMGKKAGTPDASWARAQWWESQAEFLTQGGVKPQQLLSPPPDWEAPLLVQSLEQASTAWWKAVRDYRQSKQTPMPDSESHWIAHCLAERPHELDQWMTITPSVAVPYDSLFHLKDPQWIGEFLKRGAHPQAMSMGQTAVGMTASLHPHMTIPLMDAGIDPGLPLEELLVAIMLGKRGCQAEIDQAIEAGLGLMARMEKQGQPMRWEAKPDLIAPLLSKTMDPHEARALVLKGLWPKQFRLDSILPQINTIVGRGGGAKTLPISHACAVWATQAIENHQATREQLIPRLKAMESMGVDFSFVGPNGGVFHEALLCARKPSTVETLYFSLEPMGANWHAKNKKGQMALEQKQWDANPLKQQLRESFDIPSIQAHLLSKKMHKELTPGEHSAPAKRRL